MSGSTLPMCVLREVGMRDYQGLWVHNSLWSLYAGNAAKIRQCNHGLHCLQDTSWPETGHPLPSEIPRSSATFPWGCPIANLKTGHFVFWSSTDQNHIAGSFWITQHIWALAQRIVLSCYPSTIFDSLRQQWFSSLLSRTNWHSR